MKGMQNFAEKDEKIRQAFLELRRDHPQRLRRRLELSWSNWMFGPEPLEAGLRRLRAAGLEYVEIAGTHHTPDSGPGAEEVRRLLEETGLKVSGICGLFSGENDLAGSSPYARQAAMDYIRREVEFARQVGAAYLLIVPSAVGRPRPLDGTELRRSAAALRPLGELFQRAGLRAAIEPIRAVEVSLVHTVDEAIRYIEEVDHPGIAHINGDIFHMLAEEEHIGEAILRAGDRLVNIHVADSNRGALGRGVIDLDVVIMALYLIGHNTAGRFVTGEPLGPGGDSYAAMVELSDPAGLDVLVGDTVRYFREREQAVLEQ